MEPTLAGLIGFVSFVRMQDGFVVVRTPLGTLNTRVATIEGFRSCQEHFRSLLTIFGNRKVFSLEWRKEMPRDCRDSLLAFAEEVKELAPKFNKSLPGFEGHLQAGLLQVNEATKSISRAISLEAPDVIEIMVQDVRLVRLKMLPIFEFAAGILDRLHKVSGQGGRDPVVQQVDYALTNARLVMRNDGHELKPLDWQIPWL